jgi:hypothetical protein
MELYFLFSGQLDSAFVEVDMVPEVQARLWAGHVHYRYSLQKVRQ